MFCINIFSSFVCHDTNLINSSGKMERWNVGGFGNIGSCLFQFSSRGVPLAQSSNFPTKKIIVSFAVCYFYFI